MSQFYFRGRPVKSACFQGANLQGYYTHDIIYADGAKERVTVHLTEAEMLRIKNAPYCWQASAKKDFTPDQRNSLPDDDAKRSEYVMADGLLDYFPNALAEISRWSKIGSEKHNPGEPLYWNRSKSQDHRNKIIRHTVDAGGFDENGERHSTALAWRALANLQEELERDEGYPMSRGSRAK